MGSEVISVVERRRRWSTEEKLKILMAALEPGASVKAVAERHGAARNLVYQWMRLAREGRLDAGHEGSGGIRASARDAGACRAARSFAAC